MKKLINKIKQNENLCKVLKVLKLVLDLVVYGFTIFMIIGLAIGQSYNPKESQAQVELIPNLATTPIKQAYRDNGVTTMTYAEMATPDFYYSIISTMKASEIDSDFVGLGGTITLEQPYGVYNSSYDANTNTFSNVEGIYKIVLSYDKSLDDLWELDINIYHTADYATYLRYFLYYPDSKMPFMDCYVIYSGYVSGIARYNRYLSWTFDSELINYFEIPSSYANGYTGGYNQGKKDGKAEGYTTGYDTGYNAGYNVGYTAGYEGGGLKSPFDMISQAFSSIASILNIQLIPGLTLGVLVFTPVLISIIIVVVRMIKG